MPQRFLLSFSAVYRIWYVVASLDIYQIVLQPKRSCAGQHNDSRMNTAVRYCSAVWLSAQGAVQHNTITHEHIKRSEVSEVKCWREAVDHSFYNNYIYQNLKLVLLLSTIDCCIALDCVLLRVHCGY